MSSSIMNYGGVDHDENEDEGVFGGFFCPPGSEVNWLMVVLVILLVWFFIISYPFYFNFI